MMKILHFGSQHLVGHLKSKRACFRKMNKNVSDTKYNVQKCLRHNSNSENLNSVMIAFS